MGGMIELATATFGVGAGGGAVFFGMKWLAEFFGGSMERKADRLDAGTAQLIVQLQAQVKGLIAREEDLLKRIVLVENDLRECKARHAESEAQVMRLSAMLQGIGDAREHAALIVASEKKEGKQ